ncbi:MAG: hypothetical protein NTW87_15365 [Planctomycetota bacterium]|nr:hypothetical protein [Planctomycetota bacterium]
MGWQDDLIKALKFEHPEYIPISMGVLPAAWIKHRKKLDAIARRHPLLFGEPRERDYDAVGGTYVAGTHVDIWGCVWSNVAHGMESIVTKHPVPTRADVHTLRPPAKVTGHLPHGFMYLRLCDLRGFEEMMMDFAEEPPELQMLLDIVFQHNLKELEELLKRHTGPIIYFGDDLGMQHGLPISPAKWRKYLKPCYMAMYGRCREKGLFVYMHTDGHIVEIIPDLIDCGVNVVNPQIRANGLEDLARVCKGKVCVDLDLDRQLFPFCKPKDIDRHVRDAVEALGSPAGGLCLKAEIGPDVPLPTIDAICMALEKYRAYFR